MSVSIPHERDTFHSVVGAFSIAVAVFDSAILYFWQCRHAEPKIGTPGEWLKDGITMIKSEVTLDPVLKGYIPPEYAHLIKADPHRPGPARARIVGFERPIWGIILEMITFGNVDDPVAATVDQIRDTAEAFDISIEAVRAAIAYYDLNRGAIDAKLAADEAAARGGRPLTR